MLINERVLLLLIGICPIIGHAGYLAVPAPAPFESVFKVPGRVVPGQIVPLYAPYEAHISELAVVHGQMVSQGDRVLTLTSPALRTAIDAAEVACFQKQADYQQLCDYEASANFQDLLANHYNAEQQMIAAKQRYQDTAALYADGLVAKADWREDCVQSTLRDKQYQVSLQRLEEARKKAEGLHLTIATRDCQSACQQYADLKTLQAGLVLTAPASGQIWLAESSNKQRIQVGQQVSRHAQLVTIADRQTVQLQLTLDEAQIAQLTPGCAVTVTLNAWPSQPLQGTLSAIDPMSYEAALDRPPKYNAWITLRVPDTWTQTLHFGMSATAHLPYQTDKAVIVVPKQAVVFAADTYWVHRYDVETQQSHRQKITFEAVDTHRVAITQGVQEGDCLVLPD